MRPSGGLFQPCGWRERETERDRKDVVAEVCFNPVVDEREEKRMS